MFASIEAHLKDYLERVPAEVHQFLADFVTTFKAREERIKAEIEHLKADGLRVIDQAGKEL